MNTKEKNPGAPEDLLRNNEKRMNFIVMLLMFILASPHILEMLDAPGSRGMITFCLVPSMLLVTAAVINFLFYKRGCFWLKYMNLAVMLISFVLELGIHENSVFFFVFFFPAFISSFYFSARYTVITSITSFAVIFMLLINDIDYSNIDTLTKLLDGDVLLLLRSLFTFSDFFDKFDADTITMIVFSAGMIGIADYISFSGRKFYRQQAELLGANAQTKAELTMASNIQKDALSHEFPENSSFSVYADMTPAAEVGGDLYDFFMTDDTHLAVVVGDVSGHGMAAAMYMMNVITLIRVYARSGIGCDEVMKKTNKYIEASNRHKLFITCWLGIIDLTNGKMSYTNAGHNYPVLLRRGGKPEFLSAKTNFVLGRRRLVTYNERYVKLNEGDRLVLYTDGVTEARDPQDEFFGNERLLETIAGSAEGSVKELVSGIKKAVEGFENDGKRYDDFTVLAAEFRQKMPKPEYESKVFFLNRESFDDVLDYIAERCRSFGCGDKIVYSILTASSEILANIDSYAYKDGGELEIMTLARERRVTIVFKDKGEPFDPTLRERPDITVPLTERNPGGLGIMIVRKLMDDVSYRYKDGQNILTIEKDY